MASNSNNIWRQVHNLAAKYNTKSETTYQPKLYVHPTEFDLSEITDIFCNGTTLDQLTNGQANPVYIIKWGLPGSGRSSEKVTKVISEKISKKTSNDGSRRYNDYADISFSKLIENYIPYRQKTLVAKINYELMKAYIALSRWPLIKEFLTRAVKNMNTSEFKRIIEGYLKNWDIRNPPPTQSTYTQQQKMARRENIDVQISLDEILKRVLESELLFAYQTYYKEINTITEPILQEFINECYRRKVNIVYETTGVDYDIVNFKNISRSSNSNFLFFWESLLGKISSTSDTISVVNRKSFTQKTIPIEYRIFVIYPSLDEAEIIRRSYTRALMNLMDTKEQPVAEDISSYTKDVLDLLNFSNIESANKEAISSLINESLYDERRIYIKMDSFNFIEYIKRVLSDQSSSVKFPFFNLYKYTDNLYNKLLNYSIDVLLKKYLLAGRIQQLIYLNNTDELSGRLFLDMDGVFADFETAFQAKFNTPDLRAKEPKLTPDQRWSMLMKTDPNGAMDEANNNGFFADLDILPGSDKLWESVNDFIHRAGQKVPIFLTGCPIEPFRNFAEDGKEEWVRKYLLNMNTPVTQQILLRSRSGNQSPPSQRHENKILKISVNSTDYPILTKYTELERVIRTNKSKVGELEEVEKQLRSELHATLKGLEEKANVGDIIMIFCRPEEKHLFNNYDRISILIDDRGDAKKKWKNESAIFVHYPFVLNKKTNNSYLKEDYRRELATLASNITRKTLRRLRISNKEGGGRRKTKKMKRMRHKTKGLKNYTT
jgi:hypothetical protein